MKKILTAKQMKRCDAHTIEALGVPSRTLMRRAAQACADALDGFDLTRVCVLCGTGNNGGDGMALADILSSGGSQVTVVLAGDPAACTPESAYRLARLRDLGVPALRPNEAKDAIAGATAIVDAILGIGLSRPADGALAALITAANESGAPILSIDVPSGLFADSGVVAGSAINAKRTVAIQNLKPCHALYPAALCCGEVRVADIGVSDEVADGDMYFVTDDDLAAIAPRPERSHKGSFGRILVIAGSEGMAGAAYLSALGAYRAGAGLVEVFTVEANRAVIQTLLPEAIVTAYGEDDLDEKLERSLSRANSAVVGPGLGTGELARRLVRSTLELASHPLVVDADALNIVADEGLSFPRKRHIAITPHLGEMARLTGATVEDIAADLPGAAKTYARLNGVVCVLKDAHTVISDGVRTYVNLAGCSAMAKGGSGDVLTGVIAALAAVGMPLVYDLPLVLAAAYACHLHGRAGERAAALHGPHSVLARDIADNIRR